jgi:hypothetical protein
MRIILALILLLSALPLRAAPLDEAIAAWLAEDDATALPALSALAKAGDEDAMLALGVIEPRTWESDFVRGLDRTQRIALLRKPGGLSGESWLKSVKARRALAEAFEVAQQKGDPLPLLALGQTEAARPALARAFNENPPALVDIAAAATLPDDMRFWVWWGAAMRLSPAIYPTPLPPDAVPRLRAVLAQALAPERTGSLQQMLFFSLDAAMMAGVPVPQAANLTGRVLRKGRIAVEGDVAFRDASQGARERALESARAILMTAPEGRCRPDFLHGLLRGHSTRLRRGGLGHDRRGRYADLPAHAARFGDSAAGLSRQPAPSRRHGAPRQEALPQRSARRPRRLRGKTAARPLSVLISRKNTTSSRACPGIHHRTPPFSMMDPGSARLRRLSGMTRWFREKPA